ncbi:antitoxin Xre-like helix-turn-helix domain-containing protein [Segetibacter koreensis]|uniref:antitoxin Xre-like helix-turn-helix domain-containing protein n=1 Tax=Segetibacter koreensis TaxID=398037 RepID=UPI00035DEB5F|nr:antitoxin Xre-like helix-turn-helix domain-containing protein [Segetibacter koreensis]
MSIAVSANNKSFIKNRFKGLDLRSLHAIVFSARKGLKTKIFYDFAEAIKMPEKSLANIINLSARTISNYKEQQKALEPVHAEHLLKLISLYEKGEEIFGNIDEFNYWMKKPFWNSQETPIDWVITPGGVDLLMEELDKLAQGYPV